MILTKEIIEQGKSINGGWSVRQIEIFGANQQIKGWRKLISDMDFPEASIKEFLLLKNNHLKK